MISSKLKKYNMDYKNIIKASNFIGLTGFAQVGKDETAKILNLIGFERVSLADKVRQGVYNIDPIVFIEEVMSAELGFSDGMGGSQCLPYYEKKLRFGIFMRLQNIVDKVGCILASLVI